MVRQNPRIQLEPVLIVTPERWVLLEGNGGGRVIVRHDGFLDAVIGTPVGRAESTSTGG